MNRRTFVNTALAASALGVVGRAFAATTYRPDFCFGNPCRIEVTSPGFSLVQFLGKCSAHTSIQSINALTDAQLFAAILQSSRRKEVARWGVKLASGLDEEIQFTVDADGTIHVISGLNAVRRAQLDAEIQMAIVGVEAPVGTVSIVVD